MGGQFDQFNGYQGISGMLGGSQTIGVYQPPQQYQQMPIDASLKRMAYLQSMMQERKPVADGTKPIVVCGGVVEEAKDMDDAQRIAEERAHQKSANAYILKPVRRVAPKRDVVTTDL